MACCDWKPVCYVPVSRMMYRAYIAPADDVELDGVAYGALCDHDKFIIVISDAVHPSQRDKAIDLARWEAEAAVKAGKVLNLPAKDYRGDAPPTA